MTGHEFTFADHVAAGLRAERARRKWSQAELAERAGLSQSTVSALEQGRRAVALDHLPALCRALGVSLATLAAGADPADLTALGL